MKDQIGEIVACPYCGGQQYYRKCTFSGRGVIRYRFDGEVADNTEMHDAVNYVEDKTRFCEECHRKVTPAPPKESCDGK